MLQLKHIAKEYRTGTLVQKALDDVSLNLRDNEFVAILGPSGSGKTTLLNIIGGLDRYDTGDLIINGISTKKYKDRDWDSYRNHTIGFVFQSYNLIPHQTVLSNVELALTISGVSKAERRERAVKALEQVGLGNQLHKKPSQLSGGQMQRVAIARALVNNPDILLADEPTGALDSDTSIQVMELLREVAKDRLVVMVTHNPELAEAYATRIVRLRDGKIRSDTAPYEVDEAALTPPKHKNMGKASMSLLTAFSLSFNNLRTKKARTLLTAFAGSIGIIGIAAILSLSTGVNQYIESIEEETLSEYPLQIQSTGLNLTSMIAPDALSNVRTQAGDGEVGVVQMLTTIFSTIGSNDLASLKEYLDSGESGIEHQASAVEYTYGISPQLYRLEGDSVRQVNPDQSFSSLGLGSASSSNSMMSTIMSTDMFYEMPENTALYEHQYDVKAGHWPENYNECVIVLTSNGNISDFLLYTLGLRDPLELDEMIQQFLAEEDVSTPTGLRSYSYDELLGISFKLVNSADFYEYDTEYQVWKDRSDNADFLRGLVKAGEDITIVGVVQPTEGSTVSMLTPGIDYPASLTRHVMEQAAASEIVQAQLASPTVNVFTGEAFGEENQEERFDMSSLFTVDTEALQNAFQVDQSAFDLDLSRYMDLSSFSPDLAGSLDLSGIALELPDSPTLDMAALFGQLQPSISSENLSNLAVGLVKGYVKYAASHLKLNPAKTEEYFAEYLQTDEGRQLLSDGMASLIDTEAMKEQMAQAMQQTMSSYTDSIATALESQITAAIQQSMGQLSAGMQDSIQQAAKQMAANMEHAFSFDAEAFKGAIQTNMDSAELTELLTSMMTTKTASYDGNLKKLDYADPAKPSGINIYPATFVAKSRILDILNDYNSRMTDAGEDEKVITYTDLVGTLMVSVTDIVDTISYVLVAFVAISLVVSSIMIGVITYISVLERRKEIGILRAIGASKANISQVFNAETFLIGLAAGVLGIGITSLLLIPGNAVIHAVASDAVSAVLPLQPALILIVLSVILTLLGGLLPAQKASRSDPVAALRAE